MSNSSPAAREIAAEDSIRVVCRFRPLNDSEEKAGSKFIVKFPSGGEENSCSLAVSNVVLSIVRYMAFKHLQIESLQTLHRVF